MSDEFDPSKPSPAHVAMSAHWAKVRDVLGGADQMRACGAKYLPRFPRESYEDHGFRVKASPFVNLYLDIATDLAAKPFSNEVAPAAGTSKPIKDLCEDIDARGNSLHVASEKLFFNGLNDGLCWVMVDYTRVPEGSTMADEKRLGARPYWIIYEAPQVVSVTWAMVGGEDQIVEARIREWATVTGADGAERQAERVRVYKRDKVDGEYLPAHWWLWEKQERLDHRAGTVWVLIDDGRWSVGVITLVPFLAGREVGARIISILTDVLELQIEHFQRESALKAARTMCAFPMLSASGIDAPKEGEAITVGPNAVLYGPMVDGRPATWSFVEPSATSLKFLSEDIDRLEAQMRELGRQPLTGSTPGITIVAASFAASKANSVISALAINLKDALEQALKFTAMWLNSEEQPELAMSTDFDVGQLGENGADTVLKMREAGDLSQQTVWTEMRRRKVLSPEFNAKEEERRILNELPGDATPQEQLAAMN